MPLDEEASWCSGFARRVDYRSQLLALWDCTDYLQRMQYLHKTCFSEHSKNKYLAVSGISKTTLPGSMLSACAFSSGHGNIGPHLLAFSCLLQLFTCDASWACGHFSENLWIFGGVLASALASHFLGVLVPARTRQNQDTWAMASAIFTLEDV